MFEARDSFKDKDRKKKLLRKIEESFAAVKRLEPGIAKPGSEGRVTADAVLDVFPFFETFDTNSSLVHYYDTVPEIEEMARAGTRDFNNKTVLRFKREPGDRSKASTAFHLYALNEPVLGKRRRGEVEGEDEEAGEEGGVALDTATKYGFVREYRYTVLNEASQQNCFLFFPGKNEVRYVPVSSRLNLMKQLQRAQHDAEQWLNV